jgi:hypothetical protein
MSLIPQYEEVEMSIRECLGLLRWYDYSTGPKVGQIYQYDQELC